MAANLMTNEFINLPFYRSGRGYFLRRRCFSRLTLFL